MAKVGIVTESTNCLPPELIKEYDIRVVPYTVVIEDKPYRDGIDITTGEFLKILKTAKKLPTSAAPAVGDLIDIFKELSQTTDNIVFIHTSAALSAATQEVGLTAKDFMKKETPKVNIELVDSRISVGGLALIVLEAARAAQASKDLEQVIEVAKDMIPRVQWLATLETLHYLIKGGRAPKVSGWIGEMLSIKPIIGMFDALGTVQAVGRARTKGKAIARLVEIAKERLNEKRQVHMLIQYAGFADDVEKLKEMLGSQLDCAELYLSELSPVACVHTGGILMLSFYA